MTVNMGFRAVLRTFTVVLAAILASQHYAVGVIVHPPLNEVALQGSTVILRCEAHAGHPAVRVMWGEFITNPGGAPISDNEFILAHPNAARYRIINNQSHVFHLEISDVSVTDGGMYMCQDTQSGPPDLFRGYAELVVLEANPVCNTTAPPDNHVIEGQAYTIECRLNYNGAISPRQTWSGPPPFTVGQAPPNPTTIWSGISYTVDRSMDTRAYECLHNMTDVEPQLPGVADNTPTWSYLHRAPQMFVYWGPKGMFHSPVKDIYEVGDVVTCTADANPDASYFWQNMITLQVIYSRTFTVSNAMVGYNTTMRCMAQNIINGFVYSENLFIYVYLPEPTTPTTPTTTIPTTTHPPQADCTDLTGHWIANNPRAELVISIIPGSQQGLVEGLFKNQTDTIWVEIVGTTRRPDYAFIGLASIWPFNDGVTGFSGECHRCNGVEMIIGNGMWRSRQDSVLCGHGGNPYPYELYYFYRAGTVRDALDGVELDVYKPTDVSERLGVTLKKKRK